jgi:transcriptional regulator with XRE-family HTH domain
MMDAAALRSVRKARGWNQQELAQRLGVSQGLVSLWEHGVRTVPAGRVAQMQRLGLALDPLALPMREDRARVNFSCELASLGYPGFSHLRPGTPGYNPAQLLVQALSQHQLDRRSAEALPWLSLRYWRMDWDWVCRQAKLNDLQNRLGFTLTLARKLAGDADEKRASAGLARWEQRLRDSLLARQDTYCNDRMTSVERKWLEEARSPEAAGWHMLSDLRSEHLSHA